MKKHILIVSQYFYPEPFRINDISLDLVDRGFEVTVLTGYPNYPEGDFYDGYRNKGITNDSYENIKIIRVPLVPRKQNKINLAFNYSSFVLSGGYWNKTTDLKFDAVFIYEVSPMTQALPGVWYAKENNIPCYLYVTDLWPENVQIVGNINNNLIIKPIEKMVDYIYKNSNKILTSSKSFIEKIVERGVSNEKLEFWPQYAEDYYFPMSSDSVERPEIPNDEILNLTFAGNIGYAQGLDILPKVAVILKNKGVSVRFNIIGDGRYKKELMELVQQLNVSEYFNFIGRQPGDKIKEFMAVSDGALVLLSKNELFEMTIPAKVQSCLACGMPIIASASGETKEIIENGNVGFCSPAGDENNLASNIEKFQKLTVSERKRLSNNSIQYYNENFDKIKLMNRLENLLLQEESNVNL